MLTNQQKISKLVSNIRKSFNINFNSNTWVLDQKKTKNSLFLSFTISKFIKIRKKRKKTFITKFVTKNNKAKKNLS